MGKGLWSMLCLGVLVASACVTEEVVEPAPEGQQDPGVIVEDDQGQRFCSVDLNGIAVDKSTDTAIVIQQSRPDCSGPLLKSLYGLRPEFDGARHMVTMKDVRRVRVHTPGDKLRVTARAENSERLQVHDIDPQTLERRWTLELGEPERFNTSPQGRYMVLDMADDTPAGFEGFDRRVVVDTERHRERLDLQVPGLLVEFHWLDDQTAVTVSIVSAGDEEGLIGQIQVWDTAQWDWSDGATNEPARLISLEGVLFNSSKVHGRTNQLVVLGTGEAEETVVTAVDLSTGQQRRWSSESAPESGPEFGAFAKDVAFVGLDKAIVTDRWGFMVLDLTLEGELVATSRVTAPLGASRVVRDLSGEFAMVEMRLEEGESPTGLEGVAVLVDLNEGVLTELGPLSLQNAVLRGVNGEFWGQEQGVLFRVSPRDAVVEEIDPDVVSADVLATLDLSDRLVVLDREAMTVGLFNPDTLRAVELFEIEPAPEP